MRGREGRRKDLLSEKKATSREQQQEQQKLTEKAAEFLEPKALVDNLQVDPGPKLPKDNAVITSRVFRQHKPAGSRQTPFNDCLPTSTLLCKFCLLLPLLLLLSLSI